MSDKIITQEEIDALLRGGMPPEDSSKDSEKKQDEPKTEEKSEQVESEKEKSIMEEEDKASFILNMLNIFFDEGARVLTTIFGKEVISKYPKIFYVNKAEFLKEKSKKVYWQAEIEFKSGLYFKVNLYILKDVARVIAGLISGNQSEKDDVLLHSGFFEAINQIIGSVTVSYRNLFSMVIDADVNEVKEIEITPDFEFEDEKMYLINSGYMIEGLAEGEAFVLLNNQTVKELADYAALKPDFSKATAEPEQPALEQPVPEIVEAKTAKPEEGFTDATPSQEISQESIDELMAALKEVEQTPPQPQPSPSGSPDVSMEVPEMQQPPQPQAAQMPPPQQQAQFPQAQQPYSQTQFQQMHGMQAPPPQQQTGPAIYAAGTEGLDQQHVKVQPVQFQSFDENVQTQPPSNIDLLLDVPLQVTVELGRTTKTIKEVLQLGVGSVVKLDKLAGESVELLVNDKLIAKGEVVVIDENFGIRISAIVSPMERLKKLR